LGHGGKTTGEGKLQESTLFDFWTSPPLLKLERTQKSEESYGMWDINPTSKKRNW